MPPSPVDANRLLPPAASLGALPDELKLQILQALGPNPYMLARMQEVSRDWYVLAQDDALWSPLDPATRVAVQPAEAAPPRRRTPQQQFVDTMTEQPPRLRRALRHLWLGTAPLLALTPASADPLFVLHGKLALTDLSAVPWRWSALHPKNHAVVSAERAQACKE